MDVALTRMSSKGQIVIPNEMRRKIPAGEKMLIIKNKNQFILKKASDLDKALKDDLEFARRTEEAWKRSDAGKFKSMDGKDFLKELDKW
jgi:bifunctional DNA-binding transcriptional regulator/antitoxin component of YhaV-PrlF toxin-antitoxin module